MALAKLFALVVSVFVEGVDDCLPALLVFGVFAIAVLVLGLEVPPVELPPVEPVPDPVPFLVLLFPQNLVQSPIEASKARSSERISLPTCVPLWKAPL